MPLDLDPELLVLTRLDADHPLAKAFASHLLEAGICFDGIREQSFRAEVPENLGAYKAIAVDDVLLPQLSDADKGRLSAVAGRAFVSCLPVAALLDVQGIGPMAKRIYSLHAAGHVHQLIAQAGLTLHHPDAARIQESRDLSSLSSAARDSVLAYLRGGDAWRRGWHEHTLHYWSAAMRCLEARADDELREALCGSIRETCRSMPEGLFQDELGGLCGTVWLYEQTGEREPMDRARLCMDRVLARRPRLEGVVTGSGFADGPLLLQSRSGGSQRYAGFSARRELFFTEILHMMAPALGALARGTGERRYLDEAMRMVDFVWEHHFDRNDLICQCTRRGEPVTPNWTRGMSHALQGVRYLLEEAPLDGGCRSRLVAVLQRAARGLRAVQDAGTGLWRNVLDHADARPESSGSSVFVQTFARALNRGWLQDEGLVGMVCDGARGLKRLYWRGGLCASCQGTAIGDTAYYLGRPQGWTAAPDLGSLLGEVDRCVRPPGGAKSADAPTHSDC